MSGNLHIKRSLVTMALFCIWPFLSFLNNNQDDLLIYGDLIIVYALIFTCASFFVMLLLTFILGKRHFICVAHVMGISSVCLFLYLPTSTALAGLGLSLGSIRIAIWFLLTVCILLITWKLSKYQETSLILVVISVVMVAIPGISVAHFFATGAIKWDRSGKVTQQHPRLVEVPNVYWFVFDAYPRADVLRDYFSYDNNKFLNQLAVREFIVPDKTTTNYMSTKFSISTTASMDYYLPIGMPLHPAMWTARLQGYSPVVERFKSLGYNYIHAESGGNNLKTRCGGREDRCIKAKTVGKYGINEAEVGLLVLTPLYPIIRRMFPGLISFDFTSVEEVARQLDFTSPIPQFVFAHVLSPHPPKRFDKDCKKIKQENFELDGKDYSDVIGAYLNDLTCLNPLIVELVDEIIASDESDPFIIIQSDHGYRGKGLKPEVDDPEVKAEFVSFANFNAMRIPNNCGLVDKKKFSLVNTFRIVLSCIEGEELNLLPDRHFVKSDGKLKEVHLEDF